MDRAYIFRGIEVTVQGVVEKADDGLAIRVPGVEVPLRLAPLRNKLQWNFKKDAARKPEPDEKDAFAALTSANKDTVMKGGPKAGTAPPEKEKE